MLDNYKHIFINLVIAAQAFLFLTSGAHRQRFLQVFSYLTPNDEQTQKLGQAAIIGLSVSIFILSLSSNIVLRMVSIVLFTLYVCLSYNVAMYHQLADVTTFVKEIFVIGLALAWNIDAYLNEELKNRRLNRINSAATVTSTSSEVQSVKESNKTRNNISVQAQPVKKPNRK